MKRKIVEMIIEAGIDCSNERAERIAERAVEFYAIYSEDSFKDCEKQLSRVLVFMRVVQSGAIKADPGRKKRIHCPYGIDSEDIVLDILYRVVNHIPTELKTDRERDIYDAIIRNFKSFSCDDDSCIDLIAHAIYGICVSSPIASYEIVDVCVSCVLHGLIKTISENDIFKDLDLEFGIYHILDDMLHICDIKQN